MRFAAIRHAGASRLAVTDGEELAVLPEALGDLVQVIEGGNEALKAASEAVPGAPRVPIEEAIFEAPIRRFRRDVLCTGWNYWDHFEEGIGRREGQEVPRPDRPTFFSKAPEVVIGPNDDIAWDPMLSSKWDYEAELALVFGTAGRSIPEANAMDHVWGFLLANDISQRDLQRAHGGQWLKGKSTDRTMPLGPWVVTTDEIDPSDVHLECLVNGELMQSASTAQMAFQIPVLISQLTFGMTVHPGDVLLTGTPSGVGDARDPQVYLTGGDEVVVRGSGIGELHNRLVETSLVSYWKGELA